MVSCLGLKLCRLDYYVEQSQSFIFFFIHRSIHSSKQFTDFPHTNRPVLGCSIEYLSIAFVLAAGCVGICGFFDVFLSLFDRQEIVMNEVEALTTSIQHWQTFQLQYPCLSIYLAICMPAVDILDAPAGWTDPSKDDPYRQWSFHN